MYVHPLSCNIELRLELREKELDILDPCVRATNGRKVSPSLVPPKKYQVGSTANPTLRLDKYRQ